MNIKSPQNFSDLFDALAKKYAKNVAIVSHERSECYQDFYEDVNKLAAYFHNLGLNKTDVIIIKLSRSSLLVKCLSASLKIGAVFLLLDQDTPEYRFNHICDTVNPKLIISESDRLTLMNILINAEAIKKSKEKSPLNHSLDTPAYMIFTSGSTGVPKGISLSGKGLLNHLKWMVEELNISSSDNLLFCTSINFDPSISEILVPLIAGGAVIIYDKDQRDTVSICKYIKKYKVTIIQCVPSGLANLVRTKEFTECFSLSKVICGGEILSLSLIDEFYLISKATLYNCYGPSEVTVEATYFECKKEMDKVFIGKPIANTKCYVLDENMQAIKSGEIGELYVSGIGLAIEYINQPDLTKKSFVENPFFQPDDQSYYKRLYKTRDLVRLHSDGNLEFIGRADDQIKLKGYRIEPGEIETVLSMNKNIAQCAIVLHEKNNRKCIIAYYTTFYSQHFGKNELKKYLLSYFPEYMIPLYFIKLDKIPFSINGKIDRKFLSDINLDHIDQKAGKFFDDYNRQLLAEMWSDILNVSSVSLDTHFFEMGGDSLLAMQIILRCRDVFKVDVAVKDLFDKPVFRLFSEQLEKMKNIGKNIIVAPLVKSILRDQKNYSLSRAQKGIWFIEKYKHIGPAYNVPVLYTLKGVFNIECLENSINELIKEFEAFRTIFKVTDDGEPKQIVLNNFLIKIIVKEYDEEVFQHDIHRKFYLEREPAIKVFLYDLKINQEWKLLINLHHLICDDASIKILTEKLAYKLNLVRAVKKQGGSKIIQPVDYSCWETVFLNTPLNRAHEKYWATRLKQFKRFQHLDRSERPNQVSDGSNGNYIEFLLEEDLTEILKKLSKKINVSFYSTLFSLCSLVLSNWGGQNDFIIGIPVTRRSIDIKLNDSIGFFVNTIPVRVNLNLKQTIINYFKKVQKLLLEDIENAVTPYDTIASLSGSSGFDNADPVTQIILTYDRIDKTIYYDKDKNCLIRENPVFTKTSKFDLGFHFIETEKNVVSVTVEYKPSLTSREEVNFLKESILSTLHQISNLQNSTVQKLFDSTCSKSYLYGLDDLSFFSNEESFFKQKRMCLESGLAIVHRDKSINYEEFFKKIRYLTACIHDVPGGINEIIGIHLEKGIDFVVSVLAIFNAGFTAFPIDKNITNVRLKKLFNIAKPTLIISDCTSSFSTYKEIKTIDINSLSKHRDEKSTEITINLVGKYCLFTSGSTGQPKGIIQNEKTLLNLIKHSTKSRVPCKKILQFSSIGFDVSLQEIICSIYSYATLYIIDDEVKIDPAQLCEFILKNEIEEVFIPPAILELVASFSLLKKLNFINLKRVNVAGDKLLISREIKDFFQKNKGAILINQYGPTESHVVTEFIYSTGLSESASLSFIGKPIANTRCYILNENMQLVGKGCVGELYISGVGLALEYVNQPDLTKESFIMNPFFQTGGPEYYRKLYKTGDLVKMHSNGNLEFIGRIDTQVKLRGYRIELGEIEAALSLYPGIMQSVVLLKSKKNTQYLIAYYTIVNSQKVNQNSLKQHLLEQLPKYMLPSYFVKLEKMPLTQNGKIDYKFLFELDLNLNLNIKEELTINFDDYYYQVLVSIWVDTLNVPSINNNSNFFEMGGHSLLAMKIVIRIKSALKINVSVKDLFDNPTFGKFVAYLKTIKRKNPLAIKQIRPMLRNKNDYPLSQAQKRIWFMESYANNSNLYNVPTLYKIIGPLKILLLEKVINEVVEEHEILRTVFQLHDGEIRQIILNNMIIKLINRDNFKEYLHRDVHQPFNLERGPLIQVYIYCVSKNKHYVLINMHHIICDGWSIKNILNLISLKYNSYLSNNKKILSSPKIQYIDYVEWESGFIKKRKYLSSLKYWEKALENYQDLILLPNKRREDNFSNGSNFHFSISHDDSDLLKQLSLKYNTGLFCILASIVNMLLFKYTGQEDIVLGTIIANRNSELLYEQIGCFINTVPLRTKLTNCSTFSHLIKKVKEVYTSSLEYQDLPFEILVNAISSQRDPSVPPIFQIALVYQTAKTSNDLKLAETTCSEEKLDYNVSRFEITFYIQWSSKQNLDVNIEYKNNIFKKDFIFQMSNHFMSVIRMLKENENFNIRKFSLVDEYTFSLYSEFIEGKKLKYKKNKTVISMLNESIKKYPCKIAIEDELYALTYQQLSYNINLFSKNFSKIFSKSLIIGIFSKKSVDTIVCQFAIMSLGSAFVYLDSDLPDEVLIEQCNNIDHVIDLLGCLDERSCLQKEKIIVFNGKIKKDDSITKPSFINEVEKGGLVYVIYTSGSTGSPKGVTITQDALVNLLMELSKKPIITTHDIFFSVSPFSFDMAIHQTWLPLVCGARLMLRSDKILKDPDTAINFLNNSNVSILVATPTYYHMLLLSGWKNETKAKICCGGEQLTNKLLLKLMQITKEVHHFYGPTEATVWATYDRIRKKEDEITVGYPLNNVDCYILDKNKNLVPKYIPGEIFLGGVCLSKGYLNSKELTKEKFKKISICKSRKKQLLYRTGDVGYFNDKMKLVILGRSDNQVKVRGFRVELSKIKEVILESKMIKDCEVVGVDHSGSIEVIAFIICEDSSKDEDDLYFQVQEYLFKKLPKYMLPNKLLMVSDLPVSRNGKIDQIELKKFYNELGYNEPYSLKSYKHASFLDNTLYEIWSSILNTSSIFNNTDFFDAGGDSFKVVLLSSRIKEKFNKKILFNKLFMYSKFSDQVQFLKDTDDTVSTNDLFDCGDGISYDLEKKKHIFFFPGIDGGSGVYKELINNLSCIANVYKTDIDNSDEKKFSTLDELAQFYHAAMLSILNDNFVFCGWSFGSVLSYRLMLLSSRANNRLILIDPPPLAEGDGRIDIDIYSSVEMLLNQLAKVFSVILNEKIKGCMDLEHPAQFFKLIESSLDTSLEAYQRNEVIKYTKNFINNLLLLKSPMSLSVIEQKCLIFYSKNRKLSELLYWRKILRDSRFIKIDGDHFTMLKNNSEVMAKEIKDFLMDF